MTKKILIVFRGHPFFDGRCMNMINQLLDREHQVNVLGVGASTEILYYKDAKIKLMSSNLFRNSATKYFKYFNYVKRYIRKINIDILIASDLYSMIPCAQIKSTHHAKIIYDSRELYTKLAGLKNKPLIQKIWSSYEQKYISYTDCVLANVDIDKIYLEELYQHSNIQLIKNLPGESFISNQSINLKNMLCLNEDAIIFLYQGKFHSGRGVRFSIKCLRNINKGVLVLIGDGPMKKKYLQEAQKYDMQDRVFFVDAIPYEKLALFSANADIGLSLIQPISKSYEHALPNKLFEYAISGVPVICSNLKAMRDMVATHNSGIAIDYNNENEFIIAYEKISNYYDSYVLNSTQKEKLLWNKNNHLCEIINE